MISAIVVMAAFGMIVFLTAWHGPDFRSPQRGTALLAGCWGSAMNNAPQIQTGLNSPLWPPMWGLWCAVLHRRYHRALIVGLMDCEVELRPALDGELGDAPGGVVGRNSMSRRGDSA
jgi:hypothetical protein